MPKLTPFEAPITGFHIDDRGSTAYEHLAATAREAGQQRSSMLHQEGRSLAAGLSDIGKGIENYKTDQKTVEAKADAHDMLQDAITTNNEYVKLHTGLLASFTDAKNKAYDNPEEKGDWLKKWTEDVFNPAIANFQQNAASSKNENDGKTRLHHISTLQSHFLFTIGPQAEMDRSTKAVGNSYDVTKAGALATIRGGGSLPADGTEATMLMGLRMNDDALSSVLRSGAFKGDFAKLADRHGESQHDLVLASAEEWIKSAKNPAEVEQALKDTMDPTRYWSKANNRYGLVEDKDLKHLQHVADQHIQKLKTAQTAAHTQAHNQAIEELNTVGNKLAAKALAGTLEMKDLAELDAVAKKHEAFIKPSEITAIRKDITDHQNHPDKAVVMDRGTVQKYQDLAAKGALSGQEIMSAKARGLIDKDTATELYDMNEKASKLGPGLAKVRDEFFVRYQRIIDGGFSTVGGNESPSALGQAQIFKAKREAMRLEQEAVTANKDPHTIYDAPPGKTMPAWLEKYRVNQKQATDFDRANTKPESTTRPVILQPGQSPDKLKSGTKFVIPDGPSKGMIGTVP